MNVRKRDKVKDEPLDTAEQEAICLRYEELHKGSNKAFSRMFGAIAAIVGILYLGLAANGERFHFGEAGENMSVLCSLCTAAVAFFCVIRIFGADTQSLDPDRTLRDARRKISLYPAILCAMLPSSYHFYLAASEISSSLSYKMYRDNTPLSFSLIYSSLEPNHLIWLWPVFFTGLTEYLCHTMQKGFHEIERLREAKYTYKSA
eukprot:TRINITY_DN17577_c0_g1_i1.p1 TRINITY_DN17577_c0_g1~~TRINITY_DN17577_c0_g1_i1.p1  ORF type:complete len:223 (+),score=50.17 TRINITY_DN17577_c0_g1_i1:59-670(+)